MTSQVIAVKLQKFGLSEWNHTESPRWESYSFENVDFNEMRFWAREQLPLCALICFSYLLFIWIGPLLMRKREAFNLQKPLVVWNILLALFSTVGAIRMYPEFFGVLKQPNGFHLSLCTRDFLHHQTSFWAFAFTLSKIAELIDTVFLVLRKKPVIFLHWFHHLNMVWATFYEFAEGEPIGRWVAVYNYSVHSVMYSYFALMAMKIKVPKTVPMMITLFQISQFITGLFINAYTVVAITKGEDCFRTTNSLRVQFTFACCYLFLFARLFYSSYMSKPKSKEA